MSDLDIWLWYFLGACVVTLDQCVRSDCVVTLTIRPAPRGLGAPPSPRSAFPCLFFRGGGDFFKIEWVETGLGRASSKEEAVGKIQIQYWASCHLLSLLVVRPAHGVHPRHPPRTFPLGLLAPRLLGCPAFPRLYPRARGRRGQDSCLGRGRNPLPSVGLLLADVSWSIQCFILFHYYFLFLPPFNVPSESALAQPLSSFSNLLLVVSLSLLNFRIAR